MLKLIYPLIVLLIAAIPLRLTGRDEISVGTYSGSRGDTARILINAEFDTPPDKIFLNIKYDGTMLNFLRAVPGEDYIIMLPNSVDNVWDPGESSWMLNILSDNLSGSGSGTLIALDFEILAGKEEFAAVTPAKLTLNDIKVDAGFSGGGVEVRDPPVFTDYPESLGQNYPNPFFSESTFPFSLDVETPVEFFVYDIRGRKVLDFNYITRVSTLFKDGAGFIDPAENRLGKGSYYLTVQTDEWMLASGFYIMVMKTERKVHKVNFIIQK